VSTKPGLLAYRHPDAFDELINLLVKASAVRKRQHHIVDGPVERFTAGDQHQRIEVRPLHSKESKLSPK